MNYQRSFSLLTALLLGQLFFPCIAFSSGLLIIYPSVKAPYNKIYKDIIKGIETNYGGLTNKLKIAPNNADHMLAEKIEKYQPDVLITLGRQSLKEVGGLNLSTPLVAGAITKTDQAVSGVSMTPDPEIILSHLLMIAPFVSRVYVVADTDRYAQIERANAYLKQQDKILKTEKATSIQQAADKYLKIINSASASDAIWLMRGASLNDPSILMLVLEAAWKKKIVVFSSNPAHVKRGALFSVYPDNEKMGAALARVAQQLNRPDYQATPNLGLSPLRNLHLIVNKRTSKHLGINPNNISGLNIHRLL